MMSALDRVMEVLNASNVRVLASGDLDMDKRGIAKAADRLSASFGNAVKMAFAGVVLAAASLSAPAEAGVSDGIAGFDAGVYSQGQAMRQGSAESMRVVSVRPVHIELDAQKQKYGQASDYATTAGSAALGAMLGSKLGKGNGKKAFTILGGMIGAGVGDAINETPREYVEGFEITMLNSKTNQVAVVTQAGEQQFQEGDPVLVVKAGNSVRVVLDKSRLQQQANTQGSGYQPAVYQVSPSQPQPVAAPVPAPQARPAYVDQLLGGVINTGANLGIHLDPNKVTKMLESGQGASEGVFVGKVVAVDLKMGLVYQSLGRGVGAVHVADLLNNVPKEGDLVSISFKEGFGKVSTVREKSSERGH